MSSVEETKSRDASATSQPPGCCGKTMSDWCTVAGKCAREEPVKCAAIAFLAGFICTILPIGQIVGGLLRLALGLIRPALVILGAMKLFEEFDKRRQP